MSAKSVIVLAVAGLAASAAITYQLLPPTAEAAPVVAHKPVVAATTEAVVAISKDFVKVYVPCADAKVVAASVSSAEYGEKLLMTGNAAMTVIDGTNVVGSFALMVGDNGSFSVLFLPSENTGLACIVMSGKNIELAKPKQ